MNKRDRIALIAGLVLGIVAAGLSVAAVFAAGLVFIAFSFVNPLIVSLLAQNRIMTLAQVPNLLAVLLFLPMVLFLTYDSGVRGLGGNNYGAGEITLGILAALLMAVVPALVVSGVVKLIRRRTRPQINSNVG
jgi:hypothetical protein